jgi:hypothetical protein
MLLLSILALVLVGAPVMARMDSDTSIILQHADNFVCALFLFDFARNLLRAPNRWRYMMTWDGLTCYRAFRRSMPSGSAGRRESYEFYESYGH